MQGKEYIRRISLSENLTGALINGPVTCEVARVLEKEANAYFDFDPAAFGGVLYHPKGQGPEQPYFRPEGDDWNPVVQAISRIGVQYHYWNFLNKALTARTLALARITEMAMLVVHPVGNGRGYIEVCTKKNNLARLAENLGDPKPRFPGYIGLVNYGGDADFYGETCKNLIFPMDVKTSQGKNVKVDRLELGLSAEPIDETWKSWKNIYDVFGKHYHKACMEAYNAGEFSSDVRHALDCELKNRGVGTVSNEFFLARAMIMRRIDKDENLLSPLTAVRRRINGLYDEPEEIADLFDAAKQHADNLRNLYETARCFCKDVYSY